jgi:hypothetical protein
MRRTYSLVALLLFMTAFLSSCVVGPGRRGYGHPGKHKGWYKNGKW